MQLFGGLKETRGLDTIIEQCHVISGDCSLPDLGISDKDRKLLAANVSIVYHCAATIRFDEPLKRAVLLNIRGTKLMIEMCKTFKKLDVSVQIVCVHVNVMSFKDFFIASEYMS